MKVGINGMGRMGRLALRAAFGGLQRPLDDPRRDNRLEVIHVNEIKLGPVSLQPFGLLVALGVAVGMKLATTRGRRLGLPRVVSPVGSYWFFGPGDKPGDPTIVVGGDSTDLAARFRSVTLAGRVTHAWAVREERDVPIWVCEGPLRTLQEAWAEFRGRN